MIRQPADAAAAAAAAAPGFDGPLLDADAAAALALGGGGADALFSFEWLHEAEEGAVDDDGGGSGGDGDGGGGDGGGGGDIAAAAPAAAAAASSSSGGGGGTTTPRRRVSRRDLDLTEWKSCDMLVVAFVAAIMCEEIQKLRFEVNGTRATAPQVCPSVPAAVRRRARPHLVSVSLVHPPRAPARAPAAPARRGFY
jgi:hypothetical protein